jgi:hypothetical protein
MNRTVYANPLATASVFTKTTQKFPDFLSDPLTRALMAADGVDAAALEAELRVVADRLAADEAGESCGC